MGGTYEVRRWNELTRHDIYKKLYEDLFRYSEIDKEEYTYSTVTA
jgi:hypothetical protein